MDMQLSEIPNPFSSLSLYLLKGVVKNFRHRTSFPSQPVCQWKPIEEIISSSRV